MKKINAEDRLIVALDRPSMDDTLKLLDGLDGLISFYKIGIAIQMLTGLEFVNRLIKDKKKIFLDYKYFDVEETIRKAVAQVALMGVNFLTVHGNGKIIKAAVEGRGKSDLKILSVTVLTSLDAFDLKDLGYECTVEDLVLFRAKKALEAGCDGVIASANEVSSIKKISNGSLLIVTPGIRPEGMSKNEHKRSGTPTQAIKNGADYLVVGRPITYAKNPRAAAEEIVAEMQSAFDSIN
jgi:orotidine-5'-phosphate decarboxylase